MFASHNIATLSEPMRPFLHAILRQWRNVQAVERCCDPHRCCPRWVRLAVASNVIPSKLVGGGRSSPRALRRPRPRAQFRRAGCAALLVRRPRLTLGLRKMADHDVIFDLNSDDSSDEDMNIFAFESPVAPVTGTPADAEGESAQPAESGVAPQAGLARANDEPCNEVERNAREAPPSLPTGANVSDVSEAALEAAPPHGVTRRSARIIEPQSHSSCPQSLQDSLVWQLVRVIVRGAGAHDTRAAPAHDPLEQPNDAGAGLLLVALS